MTDTRRDQLLARLESMILSGAIAPGEPLPSERALVRSFAVARSTAREALAELRLRGWVETCHGGRSRLRNPLADAFPIATPAPEQAPLALQLQILEAREVLEGEAARYAALRADAAERRMLAEEFVRMQRRAGGETTLRKARADLQFHQLVARVSHHLLVIAFSDLLYTRYFNVIHAVLEGTLQKTGRYPDGINRQHAAIFEAIMAGDGDAARREARDHIAYTRRYLAEVRRQS